MIIKPNELANLCSIYSSLRVKRVSFEDLNRFVRSSMLIDSYCSADRIIAEAVSSGLVNSESGHYRISRIGQQLGKHQREPTYQITDNAKDCFIRSILLNANSNQWCCGGFLLKFHVDTVLETFVYDRHIDESEDDTRWLMLLSDVGLVRVDQDKATIEHKYLNAVNNLLMRIRNPVSVEVFAVYDERNKIGDLAEDLALEYERERLIRNGHSSLAALVQQISKIDRSAGYDILSFTGIGKDPGSNALIEVKGTKESHLRFIWSYNERSVAAIENGRYWIYGYTELDLSTGRACGPIIVKDPCANLAKLGYMSTALDVYVAESII
jgi:hypothetical protein